MQLEDLIGRRFKYISPYSGKECDWIGVVGAHNLIFSTNKDFTSYRVKIYIISETGSLYY